jgi:hypothetical protein
MFAKSRLIWVSAWIAITFSNVGWCDDSKADSGGGTLASALVNADNTMRFVSRSEMRFLQSNTDCPGQTLGVTGSATHPIVRQASRAGLKVHVDDRTREIASPLPVDATRTSHREEWILRKVVCGSRGFSALYSNARGSGRKFVIRFFDPGWSLVGNANFTLPEVKIRGFRGGTHGRLPWRFEEEASAFRLILLDIDKNEDRSIDRAEYVALGRYEFSITKNGGSTSGYADRPGPLLTEAYLNSLPVAITPEFSVPKEIVRHEVAASARTREASIHVDVDGPVYLVLHSYQPSFHWSILPTSADIPAVHLWGPPPQAIDGLPKDAIVLRFEQHGGSKKEENARALLWRLTEPPLTQQTIPQYRAKDIILIDGKRGARPKASARNIARSEMSPDVSTETKVLIANCATLGSQDDRIECYRLRAEVLRGAKGQ